MYNDDPFKHWSQQGSQIQFSNKDKSLKNGSKPTCDWNKNWGNMHLKQGDTYSNRTQGNIMIETVNNNHMALKYDNKSQKILIIGIA